MTPAANYYDILGVKKDATPDQIKKAFRKLARKHHPDVGGDEEKFKEINSAYETLSDTEKRAQYDQYGQYFGGNSPAGRAGPQRGPGGGYQSVNMGDMGDLGDLFGSVFGGGMGGGRGRGARRAQKQPARGGDLQLDLDLSFEAAFAGTSTQIEVDRDESCSACKGSGAKPGTSPVTCTTCAGSGHVSEGQGMFGFSRECPRCGGSGSVIESPCATCRGTGAVKKRVPVGVNVPAGATDGGKLRFKGKGASGSNGGPAGDLYVVTRIKPHPYFVREGADVLLELPVSYSEVALGAQITVPTPDGSKVKIKVPPGTKDGAMFRIKGKGAPRLKGAGSGDLKVKVRIDVPKQLTETQREALAALAAEQTEDLRAHIG